MVDHLTRPATGHAPGEGATAADGQMPLVEHLRELRTRLIKAVLAVVPGTALGAVFYREIGRFLVSPVCEGGTSVRADGTCPPLTQVGLTSPLTTAILLSVTAGVLLAAPVILYQAWAFVTPALYRNERRWTLAFLFSAVPFFFAGAALCYWIMPNAVRILLGFTIGEAGNLVPVNDYLNIFVRLILVFGFAFQLPVFLVMLSAAGVLHARTMRRHWRPITFGVFLFAAVATPTGDPFTMLALAFPLCLLLLGAYGFAVYFDRRRARKAAEPDYTAYDDDEVSDLDLAPSPLDDDEEPSPRP